MPGRKRHFAPKSTAEPAAELATPKSSKQRETDAKVAEAELSLSSERHVDSEEESSEGEESSEYEEDDEARLGGSEDEDEQEGEGENEDEGEDTDGPTDEEGGGGEQAGATDEEGRSDRPDPLNPRRNLLNKELKYVPEVENYFNVAEESDSEEEEGMKNRIGNVPLHWYNDYEHIGYDVTGKRIVRKPKGDTIDKLLQRRDDPDFKATVYDALNDREHVLTDRELEIIRRLQGGAMPHAEHDAMPDYVPYYTADEHPMPLSEVGALVARGGYK